MKRKIIKQGNNTLTITLPTKWAKELNLNPGEEIDVVEKEGALLINGRKKFNEKRAVIDITGFTVPLLWRFFQSAYRAGCDEIKVIFDPDKKKYEDAYHYYTTQFDYAKLGEKMPPKPAIAMIQEVVNRFVGVDIIESGENYCIVKEMGEISAKEFPNSMRRIFLVILQMFHRLREAIENNEINDPTLCKEIHTIDLNVDKFVDYCARILNKAPDFSPESRKSLIFSSLFILELIGDEFKYAGKHLALTKKPVKEILPLLKVAQEHFEMYYNLFYKFDKDLAIELGKKDVEVYEKHYNMKDKMKGENRSILTHIMRITKYTLSLAELRIEMEYTG
jgi:phosphate uptake regulator